ncbi:MAG: translation initiation factor IF-2 [Tenericutes bacterium]|nr:translation initiation factor IF-2 [Mycoplasmatota bacterium]
MNIKEYALELGIDSKTIINKLNELGFEFKNENELLDDEALIVLDNELGDMASVDSTLNEELASKYELEDRAEEVALAYNIEIDENTKVVEKIKRKEITPKQNQEELSLKKKKIYKSKEKLQSNKESVESNIVLYKEGMSVLDLSIELNVPVNDIVKKLISMGLMISSNQNISYEDASILVLEYNKELVKEETTDITNFEEYIINEKEEDLEPRAAVVTIMGHVDHGKTTLLDYIRNSQVAQGEAGGITQAIGAYQVVKNNKKITFIDTPGHAAFTEMRARGASVTDIVIIIVAADDGIMPQTKEAVDHAKAANVPIIVAINKIDKPNKNVDKIMSEMSELGLTPEEWGGDTIFVKISAQTGEGIDLLLDNINALSEVLNLKANPNRYAIGSVIEARLDKNIGPVVTLLIQNGTLRIGDPIVVGVHYGKVRTLKNDINHEVVSAEPSKPVEVTGLEDVPVAGDKFMAFESEKEARSVAFKRKENEKAKKFAKKAVSLEELFEQIKEGRKEINIVLKTDAKGSEEAVRNSLLKIDVEGVKINIVRSGTGNVTESDVVLANASNAVIIGFNLAPSMQTKETAKSYGVEIRTYNIIYKVVEEIEAAMKGMLDPTYEEIITGNAEVRQLFHFSKVGSIAGCHVISGNIKMNSECRVIRDGIVVVTSKISSLQREKNSVREVKNGYDCGITIENFLDIKEKDIIETFEMKEVKIL